MIDYLRLELKLGEEEPAQRPAPRDEHREWWGPLIRRVFGRALIDIGCPVGQPACQDRTSGAERCMLDKRCAYGVLFAESLTDRPPFALFVPPTEPGELPQRLEITLLGPAVEHHVHVVLALARAVERGLGQARRRVEVLGVERIHPDGVRQTVCEQGLRWAAGDLEPDRIDFDGEVEGAHPLEVTVELASPARLVRDGKLLKSGGPVPLEVLVGRALDRIQGVYGEGALERLDRERIESLARRAHLAEHHVEWVEVPDWSSRKRSKMLLGGKVGRMTFDGVALELLPLLRAAEVTHIGKNPTAGCGRVSITL